MKYINNDKIYIYIAFLRIFVIKILQINQIFLY
jgi:hypothetical protein